MLLLSAILVYIKHLVNIERRLRTIEGYKSDLEFWRSCLERQFNAPVELSDLNEESTSGFLLWLKQERNYKPASRRRIAATIKGFLAFIYIQKWIDVNLAESVPKIKVPDTEREYLLPQQVKEWVETVQHDVVKVAMWLMYYAGLRISEAIKLKMDSIVIEENGNGWIDIKDSKGGKSRRVPLAPKLIPILQDYYTWRTDSPCLLATEKTGTISPGTIQSEMREARRKLGWPDGITPHTLRHSFASHVYQKTGDILVVSRLLGHAKLSTAQVYAHIHEDQITSAVKVF